MCGIFIWINKNRKIDARRAAEALMLQNSRGPDSTAIYFWDGQNPEDKVLVKDVERRLRQGSLPEQHYRVAIGSNRLAINDPLPRANQPMFAPDERAVITFNGCIYNFHELRAELEAKGEVFTTTGDTEVLLRCLARGGQSVIPRLNGAWAFAYFDPDKSTVILSRDRTGERPLFYYRDDETFIAASEIKTIYAALGNPTRELRPSHLLATIAYRHWPFRDGERTLYKNIQRLMPGSTMTYRLDTHHIEINGGNTVDTFLDGSPDPEQIVEDLERSVAIRLRADAPIAVLLSGGVDSSFIAAMIKKFTNVSQDITFYTAGLPGNGGLDLPFARRAAEDLGVDLNVIEMDTSLEILPHLRALTEHYDMPVPFSGPSVGMSFIYQAMARDGVRVVFDGTGGDEVFGGYRDAYVIAAVSELASHGRMGEAWRVFREALAMNWIDRRLIIRAAYERGFRRPYPASPWRHYKDFVHPCFTDAIKRSITFSQSRNHLRLKLQDIQLDDMMNGCLPMYTAYSDNNSMFSSIEVRSPFLDYTLFKYIRLPVWQKYNSCFNKYALRKSLSTMMTSDVAWRKGKKGAPWVGTTFLKRNKAYICDSIKKSTLLSELLDGDRFVSHLMNDDYGMYMLQNLYSVSLFSEIFDCTVASDG